MSRPHRNYTSVCKSKVALVAIAVEDAGAGASGDGVCGKWVYGVVIRVLLKYFSAESVLKLENPLSIILPATLRSTVQVTRMLENSREKYRKGNIVYG